MASPTTLWLSLGPKRLTVGLSTEVNAERLVEVLRRSATELSGLLGASEADELSSAIERELGEPGACPNPMAGWPAQSLPLADALRALADATCEPHALRAHALFAGSQALWLGHDTAEVLPSLRFFVSMIADPHRRGAYAAAATGRECIVVDEAPTDPAVVHDLLTLVGDRQAPALLELREGRWEILASSRAKLDIHAGSLLGPVVVDHVRAWPDSPPPVLYFAFGRTAAPNLSVLSPADRDGDFVDGVKGVDVDEEKARLKCVAEGVERFVAGDLDADKLVKAPAIALDGPWLHPESIIRYSSRQVASSGVVPFSVDQDEWWVRCSTSTAPCWVPAALVYAPFPETPGWLRWGAVTSNGVAAHRSLDEAVAHAWFELAERDAFQRMWLAQDAEPVCRIQLTTVPTGLHGLVRTLLSHGDLTVLSLKSYDDVPVFVARLDRSADMALGAGAAPDPEEALRAALAEACAQLIAPLQTEAIDDPDVKSPIDHGGLFAAQRRRETIRWMLSGPERPFSVVRAYEAGVPDRALWFSFPGLQTTTIHVARAIDPSLIPITFGYDSDLLGRDDVQALCRAGGRSTYRPLPVHPFA